MYLRLHKNNRRLLTGFLKPGDQVCDATCGNGHDTLFLAQQVLPKGQVTAIDRQRQALASTQARLEAAGYHEGIDYIEADHAHLKELVLPEQKLIFFNLGYLPHSDHRIRTQAESSLEAVKAAAELLAPGGILSIMLYFDPPEGPREAEAILAWARGLSCEHFAVLESRFLNMPKDPPVQLLIENIAR